MNSASFTQIEEAGGDIEKIKAKIQRNSFWKRKNAKSVTGSGGMLIGVVEKIGEDLEGK